MGLNNKRDLKISISDNINRKRINGEKKICMMSWSICQVRIPLDTDRKKFDVSTKVQMEDRISLILRAMVIATDLL